VPEPAGFTVSTSAGHGYLPRGVFDVVVADLSEVSLGYLHRRYSRVRALTVVSEGGRLILLNHSTRSQLAAVRRLARR